MRRGVLLALVTDGRSDVRAAGSWPQPACEHAFDAVVVSAELGVIKPDAGVYLHACAELGVAPAEAAMVGDGRPDDVDGPLAAGLAAAVVARPRDDTPAGAAGSLHDAVRRLWPSQPGLIQLRRLAVVVLPAGRALERVQAGRRSRQVSGAALAAERGAAKAIRHPPRHRPRSAQPCAPRRDGGWATTRTSR